MTYLHISGFFRWTARVCVIISVAAPAGTLAQNAQPQEPQEQQEQQEQQGEPAATSSSGWMTKSSPVTEGQPQELNDGQPPFILSPEQIHLVGRINDYLNGLVDLEGRFIQTDHRNEESHGRFYVHRPGKLRFDYSAPSKLRIVSDGEYFSVEDHDLNTVDKFPLDATPVQLLLGKDVDLLRDAVVLDMHQDDTAVVVLLKDKSGTSPGQLQLFFKQPELELYEWVITDAQGLDTRIQLADLVTGREKSEDFFQASAIELENLGNN